MIPPYSPTDLPAACAAFTGQWEGTVLWPYLDTDGNVTAGTGHEITDAAQLAAVFGVDLDDAQVAWTALKAAPAGKPAEFYEGLASLRLTPAQVQQLFELDLQGSIAECVKGGNGFWNFPGPCQVALVDCAFNTGSYFPAMAAAIAAGNYEEAAAQSHRKELPEPGGIPKARNDATAALIMSVTRTVTQAPLRT